MIRRLRLGMVCLVAAVAFLLAASVEVLFSGLDYSSGDITITERGGVERPATFADGVHSGLFQINALAVVAPVAFPLAILACLPLVVGWPARRFFTLGAVCGAFAGAVASFVVYTAIGGWGPPAFVGSVFMGAFPGLLHPLLFRPSGATESRQASA